MPDTIIQVETDEGELFTLVGEGKGDRGIHLAEDVNGLWMNPGEELWNSTAFQDGADPGGWRNDKRDIEFDVHILRTSDASWEENWSAWMKAWRPGQILKLWYETENSRRWLDVQLSKHVSMAPKIDPERANYAKVSMSLTAGVPWWQEAMVTEPFVTVTDTTVSGTEDGTVKLYNTTPLDLWPIWLFQGTAGIRWTIPDFSWGQEADRDRPEGVDVGRKIVMPPTIANEHVLIDTDPLAKDGQANSSLDTEYYQRMNGVRFIYQVPPYTGTKRNPILLPIAVTGAPIGAGIQLRMRRFWPTPMGMQ